jgi:hypothetical protein
MTLTEENLKALARFLEGLTELSVADGITLDSSIIYNSAGDLIGYLDFAPRSEGDTIAPYAYRPPEG